MKCSQCIKEGKKSNIYIGGGTTTAMSWPPYYDENGEYHHHDANIGIQSYSCSNGHSWQETLTNACPNAKCDWVSGRRRT